MKQFGIVVRYHQNEVTRAAIHLANNARMHGLPVTMMARDVCRREVSSSWDNKVIDDHRYLFDAWVTCCEKILWTRVPTKEALQSVSDMGLQSWLLANWEELKPSHEIIVKQMDKVIVPHKCIAFALQRKWALKTAITMPWDVALPFVKQPDVRQRETLNVLFPLYDSQPQRSDQAAFMMMHKVLSDVPDAKVIIAQGRGWSISARNSVKKLRRAYGERIEVHKLPDELARARLFSQADMVVWLPRFESFALVGLTAMCFGVPIITWDMRPQNDFLTGWKNAILVPCQIRENWLTIPEVIGGYETMAEMLVTALHDKALLWKMKAAAAHSLESQRKQFQASWTALLK